MEQVRMASSLDWTLLLFALMMVMLVMVDEPLLL